MNTFGVMGRWKNWVRQLKIETYTLYLACSDPRVPWYAKAFIACVVGYAFSPIDLIPDFIPILGYVDDLVLVPLGITLALRMIPQPVLEECRVQSRKIMKQAKPESWVAGGVIIFIWVAVITLVTIKLIGFQVS